LNALSVNIEIIILQKTKEDIQKGLNIKSFALFVENIQNIRRLVKR